MNIWFVWKILWWFSYTSATWKEITTSVPSYLLVSKEIMHFIITCITKFSHLSKFYLLTPIRQLGIQIQPWKHKKSNVGNLFKVNIVNYYFAASAEILWWKFSTVKFPCEEKLVHVRYRKLLFSDSSWKFFNLAKCHKSSFVKL